MASKRNHRHEDVDLEAAGHTGGPESGDGAVKTDQAVADLQRERDEYFEKYQRALADFRNYQQRAIANEREARVQGASGVLHSVVRLLDYFDLALAQDPAKATAEQIIGGVRLIRDELARAIGAHGVTPIEPRPNDEFDPLRHEAVRQESAEGVAPGRIASMMQAGYALGDRVLRPAKVGVAPLADGADDGGAEAPDDER